MTATLLFSSLTGVSLLGLALGYNGIARLKRASVQQWPVYHVVFGFTSSGLASRPDSVPVMPHRPLVATRWGGLPVSADLIGYFLQFLRAAFTGVVAIGSGSSAALGAKAAEHGESPGRLSLRLRQ